MIRYVFPTIDPWSLEPDDFARIWREADFCIRTFKLITREPNL